MRWEERKTFNSNNTFHVKLTSFNLSEVFINFNKSFEFLSLCDPSLRSSHLLDSDNFITCHPFYSFIQLDSTRLNSAPLKSTRFKSIHIARFPFKRARCMSSIRISRVVSHFRVSCSMCSVFFLSFISFNDQLCIVDIIWTSLFLDRKRSVGADTNTRSLTHTLCVMYKLRL